MLVKDPTTRATALSWRLQGWTCAQIGERMHLTRQRVEQLLSAPPAVVRALRERAEDRCERCGLSVSRKGTLHVHDRHHCGTGTYGPLETLELLCLSCHRQAHWHEFTKSG